MEIENEQHQIPCPSDSKCMWRSHPKRTGTSLLKMFPVHSHLHIRKKMANHTRSINNNVGRKMSHFTPPTVEEVQEYCFERGNAVDAQSFVDF